MSLQLEQILHNVKLARDFARQGNYETCTMFYQNAIQQMQSMQSQIDDLFQHRRLQEVQNVQINFYLYFMFFY